MVVAAGTMYRPTDIAFGNAGVVFVVEQFNHRVSKWTYTQPSYTFTLDASWGNNGDGTTGEAGPVLSTTDNNLYRPSGIVFDSTNSRLYVTDTFHNRVRVIDPSDGSFLDSVGQGGSGTADFYHPFGININSTDATVVIADEFNHRAVKYDPNGTTLIDPALLPAPTPLPFNRPHGVIFDNTVNVFIVTDTYHGVLNAYNSSATMRTGQVGSPGTTGTEIFFPSSGHGELGGSDNPFADTRNNELKLAGSTIELTTGTSAGTGDGELYWPESVTAFTDTVNYVLAANTYNNRIEIYSNTAAALTAENPFNFGSP